MRAVAVSRAGSLPASPVYQITELAAVPAVSAVALSKGGPATRSGGLPASAAKNSLEACTAEAAASAPPASLPMPALSAFLRFVVVDMASAPMVNWVAPGGELVVAVSVRFSLEPSGRANRTVSVSPALGTPVSEMPSEAGAPVGPLTVALAMVELTDASLRPKTVASSVRLSEVALGDELLEAGARAVAVEDAIDGFHRRLVGGAAGKQVAVAGLRVEQAEQFVERGLRGQLRRRGAAAVGAVARCRHGRFDRTAEGGHAAERGLRQADAGEHGVDGVVVAADGGKLGIEADGDAAVEPEAGIAVGFLAGAELALQLVELRAHAHQLLDGNARLAADRGNAHGASHLQQRREHVGHRRQHARIGGVGILQVEQVGHFLIDVHG